MEALQVLPQTVSRKGPLLARQRGRGSAFGAFPFHAGELGLVRRAAWETLNPVPAQWPAAAFCLPLSPLLDDLDHAISERRLALAAQHAFERHSGRAGNRVVLGLPAPDVSITGDSARAISPVDSPSALRQR